MSTIASEWRAAGRPGISQDDSSELIQRAVVLQLLSQLDDQIEIQKALWVQRDQDWADATGLPFTSVTIKPVNKRSIYLGSRLSLEDAPEDTLPAITVRCFNSIPTEDHEQGDQFDSLELTLVVEVWVVAGPFTDPVANQADQDQIDRQLHRLTAAVRGSINADRSLGATTMGIRRPPRTVMSLPWVRKATATNIGKKYLMQAAELTYTVTSLSF